MIVNLTEERRHLRKADLSTASIIFNFGSENNRSNRLTKKTDIHRNTRSKTLLAVGLVLHWTDVEAVERVIAALGKEV